jgi:hypothetical protein
VHEVRRGVFAGRCHPGSIRYLRFRMDHFQRENLSIKSTPHKLWKLV